MNVVHGTNEKQRRKSEAIQRAQAEQRALGKLSMYDSVPTGEVALEDFERNAVDRLRVLKGIEDAQSRGTKPHELETTDPVTGAADPEGELKDVVSHYVLRLAYCRTEELRRWFLTQECILFKLRFKALRPAAQVNFMSENNLPYYSISAEEFAESEENLQQVLKSQYVGTASLQEVMASGAGGFYKVPFEEVADLVRARKVLVVRGQAYVPREHLASLVVGVFRTSLSKALAVTSRQWASKIAPVEGDRLAPIVDSIGKRHLGTIDFSQGDETSTAVTVEQLDSLSQRSFPLCMRHLYNKVKVDHHTKHFGRLQLGLFLKGIGLSLEDALRFWKTEFSKKMPAEKWEKQYAYGVRYNYGKEGKRADYTPYSCMKIIMSTPGEGDAHGCPYRNLKEDNLRAALRSMNLNNKAMDEVLDKVRNQHYQLACQSTFEGTHNCSCDVGINHPNQYFKESRKVLVAAYISLMADEFPLWTRQWYTGLVA
eukprot:gene620-1046_t